jgi:hypothetical protein
MFRRTTGYRLHIAPDVVGSRYPAAAQFPGMLPFLRFELLTREPIAEQRNRHPSVDFHHEQSEI